MKYIIAIVQPDRMDDVLTELENNDIHYATVTAVLGGAGKRESQQYIGATKKLGIY